MESRKYVVRIISSLDNNQPERYQYIHDSLELREILRKIEDNKKTKDYIVSANLPDNDIKLLKALIVVDFSSSPDVTREKLADGINIDGIKYYSCSSCGLGATEHLAFLPDEVFGKDDVRIRFRPYDSVMSIFPLDWDGDVETSHVYSTSKAQVYFNLEYAMIRYRKN